MFTVDRSHPYILHVMLYRLSIGIIRTARKGRPFGIRKACIVKGWHIVYRQWTLSVGWHRHSA